ncbi:hypothetical protein MLD38_037746 [Melastoma candidum]|uniref:Uncharacterized protein n=1 Tax=Melastoma candidum TaxID=119954 RepID=A0ACB9LN04_9MYRT|nr:hypothetical protein MLD38_037746 [Melastoma candidum]
MLCCRGCQLRRLRVMYCWSISDEGMAEAARRMPFLETFEYCFGNFDKNTLMSIGMNCPCRTTFIYGKGGKGQCIRDADGGAFAIAKYMPGLLCLSLFGNGLMNKGLGAISVVVLNSSRSAYVIAIILFSRAVTWKRNASGSRI